MDEYTHTELAILQSAELPGRTPFCPEDRQIAEFYDELLPADERATLERHLADCRFCLARVGMLQRLEQDRGARSIPEDVLATAKTLKHEPVHRSKATPFWAAAAVLAIAAGVFYQLFPLGQLGQDALPRNHQDELSSSVRETRTIDPAAIGPRFLSPSEGATLVADDSLFSWTPVPSSLFYQVRIVSEEGDLLWHERVDGTEWRVPDSLGLAPGAEYFVRIDAYLTEAKSLQSEYLLFRFGGDG